MKALYRLMQLFSLWTLQLSNKVSVSHWSHWIWDKSGSFPEEEGKKTGLNHHVQSDKCLFCHCDLCGHVGLHLLTFIYHNGSPAIGVRLLGFFNCISKVFTPKNTECHGSPFILVPSVDLEAFCSWLMSRQMEWDTFPIASPSGNDTTVSHFGNICCLVERIKLEKNVMNTKIIRSDP